MGRKAFKTKHGKSAQQMQKCKDQLLKVERRRARRIRITIAQMVMN